MKPTHVACCVGLLACLVGPQFAQSQETPAEPTPVEAPAAAVPAVVQSGRGLHLLTNEELEQLSPGAQKEVKQLLIRRLEKLHELAPTEDMLQHAIPARRSVVVIRQPEAQQEVVEAEEQKAYHYMIGIALKVIEPTEDGGANLEVNTVIEESPAAKAGLQHGDRILQLNGEPLDSINSLLDKVEAAELNEVTLTIQRGDETLEVPVTPVKRPEEYRLPQDPLQAEDYEVVLNWVEALQQQPQTLQFHAVHGGLVARNETLPLPEGLSVRVEKSGGNPAKVTVKRKGESWSVDETELDQLPADVRGHVEGMLGRKALHFRAVAPGKLHPPVTPRLKLQPRVVVPAVPAPQIKRFPGGGEDAELKKIETQLKALQEAVDELRKAKDDQPQN